MAQSTSSNARRLVFTGKQQVNMETFDPGQPATGQVRIRTHLSLMSTGTENIAFNRLFEPGTHWDKWVQYPFYPGYASVGTIEAVGEGVEKLKVGQRVAFRQGHRSHAVEKAEACHPIPEGIPFEQAVWFALAKITFHGAKAAGYSLGDSALIIGAGPIGQMSLRWARAAGVANILAVDTAAHRMPLAKAGGATALITAAISEARGKVLAGNEGKLPRVVVDSTGNSAVFAAALGLAADYGKVIILGDTGAPAQQALTSDVITRGLSIIGVHDCQNTLEWNEATIVALFFKLAVTGRFPLDGLNSHVFKPENYADAYATANRDRASTMGLVFNWAA